jgi:HEAT repeat protein
LARIATTPGNLTIQYRAIGALAHIGLPAQNALASIVTNLAAGSAVRSRAAVYLSIPGARAGFAIPNLLIALQDPDDRVAVSAADALGNLKFQPARVVPALIKAATHSSLAREVAAMNALANWGPQAQNALPALREISRSDDRSLRYYAACAIATIENRRVPDVIAEVEQRHVVNTPIQ